MENNCKYISSRGFLKSTDIHSSLPYSDITKMIYYDFSKLHYYSSNSSNSSNSSKNNCSIYITTSCLPEFLTIIRNIPCNFILLSGDSDVTVSDISKYKEILENPKVIHWYAQNCLIKHNKITNLPIGIDYHTISNNEEHWWGIKKSPIEQENDLLEIIKISKPFWERLPCCYSNFHFNLHQNFNNPRKRAIEVIPKDCIYYEPKQISRIKSWTNQIEYAFVVSPPGGGLDCHRTWEALCLGCIVIVEKSNIDSLYDDLPVLIVNNFDEINKELLENTIINFKNKIFNYSKLLLSYYLDKIK